MPEHTPVPTVDWAEAQAALRDRVDRLTTMLRTVADPGRNVLGDWTLTEVAMHLSQAWMVVPDMAREDLSHTHEVLPGLAETADTSLIRDVRDLGEMTKLGVNTDPERDLGVLADRIDQRAAEFFAESEGRARDDQRVWLVEGATVPVVTLTGHLLNETIMHGYDIALAAGVPWKIERTHAAMVIAGFLVPVIQALEPRAMVDQRKAAGLRVTYDVRIRGGARLYFVFDDGELHIEEPSVRRVDCHLSADPVAMLLLAWNRKSQWSAIAKGQLVAWGRKPWLGPRFRSLMHSL